MLHSIDSSILCLQQEDLIKAGVLDMKLIVDAVEKVYSMMGKGELRTPHKVGMMLPEEGDDWTCFFNSMPAYLGGGYNIAGFKWAAESRKNFNVRGIPMGIDITVLSDPDTVLPFCICDGTLITAMRTAGVAGVLAKHVAPSCTETATVIGAGVVGRNIVDSVHVNLPAVKKIFLCDLDLEKAKAVAAEYGDSLGVEIVPVSDGKAASLQSQITVSATTSNKGFINRSWIAPGSGYVSMMAKECTPDMLTDADGFCVDYWAQIQNFDPMKTLKAEGKLKDENVIDLSDLVLGNKKVRISDDQYVMGTSLGLGALDIMIAYMMYENASKLGLGKTIKLWDAPHWE